jgi:hypothetical protein
MMKVQQPVPSAPGRRPAQPAQARRVWRVFEYRRPPAPVRPRFTT